MNQFLPKIGFAGMTHLGINSAVAAAERGFSIIGYDPNSQVIAKLQKQNPHDPVVIEPDLPEMLLKNKSKMLFSDSIERLNDCDIVYISSDVPTDTSGNSDLTGIYQLINTVSQHLKSDALLVILCQVPPGFTRGLSKRMSSEINISPNLIYYQVETLVFGQAVSRALNPERFIIGCLDPNLPLAKPLQTLLSAFNCSILPMRYESAELAKISINCCLVASIGVANTLSEICEHIGADWSEIAPALKLDKRIGPHAYLSPGLGLAGGNLERDLTTVVDLSMLHGTDAGIVESWIKNSQYRRDWVLRTLHQHVFINNSEPHITVLGLAYKENTHSTKNSPSLALLESLKEQLVQQRITVYDPVVSASVVPFAKTAASVNDAITGAEVLILMTPWPEFKTIQLEDLIKLMRRDGLKNSIKTIIDPYQLLKLQRPESVGFKYFTLGR